jgi:hypothetical protein
LNQSRTTRAGRKLRRFADAEQDAGAEELAEILHQPAQELREGPQAETHGQKQARPQAVDHGAGRQLRECIGPQKGGEQIPHLRDRQTKLFPDQGIGDGQRRAVDVIDDAGNDQQSESDTLNRFKTRCRKLNT